MADIDRSSVSRGTSPSKAHDQASQTAWDANHKGIENPQQALNERPQKNPISPESLK